LLCSTDGELGLGLLHPKHHVSKTYLACIEGRLGAPELKQLESGVELAGSMTQPAQVEVLGHVAALRSMQQLCMPSERAKTQAERRSALRHESSVETSVVRITIHEGKYHQVKLMLGAVGHPVLALHRESFGPLKLGTLQSGKWRLLSTEEEEVLRACIVR
ncbi:MAG: rRNA pseudouridine synthase, partial [Eggerthellaceae bacterium]|nr:rRNA pseudouridine synthase [Eggerthellaceae bacterium]